MNKQELISSIQQKQSFLCVGLDPELEKLPPHLLQEKDPIFSFNQQIIDATHDICVAYKPNSAFYESYGLVGWQSLEATKNYIPQEVFSIIDAKRGDIGNTSKMYAKAFLEKMGFDAITIAPYMGKDSVSPFLEFKDKWAIVLALTSNEGSSDFQKTLSVDGKQLYEDVLLKTQAWGNDENMMYVVGATRAADLGAVRKLIPNHFILVPGVGAQGGSLEEVCKYGMNESVGLLINSSRGIIYAGKEKDFAQQARKEALKLQEEMKVHLEKVFG
ncbi:MAG: orotidine-5'-phosphate decarboxylase [Bacteroidota bacterium]